VYSLIEARWVTARLMSAIPIEAGANANVAGLPRRTKNRRYAHHVEPMFGKRPVKA
jgi:hypothetical protein